MNNVQLIRQSGEHLHEMIDGILRFTDLMVGRVSIHKRRYAAAAICNTSKEWSADKVKDKQQTLYVATEPEDLVLLCDVHIIHAILARLLDNAVKFTPPGGQIGLEIRECKTDGTVQLMVWDTGIGIDDEQVRRIYAPCRPPPHS